MITGERTGRIARYTEGMRSSRILMWAIAGVIGATVIAPIASIQFPSVKPGPDEVILCGMLVLAYLITALACAVALENGRSPRFMFSGIIAGAGALAGWLGLAAAQPAWPIIMAIQRVLIWPTGWAIFMMLTGILLLPNPHSRPWLLLRRVTIGLLALVGAHVSLAISLYPDGADWAATAAYEDIAVRTGGIIMILAAGCVVVTMLMAWMARLSGVRQVDVQRREYRLKCPRCEEEQEAITGTHACRRCGLRIRVQLS